MMDQKSFNKGMIEAVEGAVFIIDFALRHGYDLTWVRSALLISISGLTGQLVLRTPVSAEEAAVSLKDIIEKIREAADETNT